MNSTITALLIASLFLVISSGSQAKNSADTSNPSNAKPLIEKEIDLFGDEEESDSAEVEEPHEEERGVIDERPKSGSKFIEIPPVKKVVTDDDKYKKARMYFLFGQYKRAYHIWQPLAEKGHAKSQATIAWMYHIGKGVKKDLAIARGWYEKAAEKNHVIALNNLGVFYEQGLGVHKSLKQAAHWYKESAEWGYSYAQYNLGTLYKKGKGVKKDINKAIYWLELAALQGVEEAQQTLSSMSKSKKKTHPSTKAKPVAKPSHKVKQPAWERGDTGKIKKPASHSTTPPPHKDKNSSMLRHKFHPRAEKTNAKTDITKLKHNKMLVERLSSATNKPIANHEWIKQQNPKSYTLQIAGSNKLDKLLSLANSTDIASDLAYYKTTYNGKVWYSLIYGSFKSFSEASSKTKSLPTVFNEWSPWVRKMADVQDKILTDN